MTRKRHWAAFGALFGLAMAVGVIAWAHVISGGRLSIFLQPAAALVVFGGTLAALVVSFPGRSLWRACVGVIQVLRHRAVAPEELIPAFANYATKVQRKGLMAVEDDIAEASDSFLARALTLTVTGMSGDLVRHALEIDARVCAERDDEQAQVIEAAAGYAPTLGVVGAVLGLMHVMQRLSASGDVGVGIAAAFVATVYGVGVANLVFLPLATRLRSRARLDVLRRELTIDGVMALRDGMHPSLVEDRLAGYLQRAAPRPTEAA